MGPTCVIKGKVILCLCRWTPNGSIIFETLTNILATCNYYKVFDRTTGLIPFLLVDGHGSSF